MSGVNWPSFTSGGWSLAGPFNFRLSFVLGWYSQVTIWESLSLQESIQRMHHCLAGIMSSLARYGFPCLAGWGSSHLAEQACVLSQKSGGVYVVLLDIACKATDVSPGSAGQSLSCKTGHFFVFRIWRAKHVLSRSARHVLWPSSQEGRIMSRRDNYVDMLIRWSCRCQKSTKPWEFHRYYYLNGLRDLFVQIDVVLTFHFHWGLPGKCFRKSPQSPPRGWHVSRANSGMISGLMQSYFLGSPWRKRKVRTISIWTNKSRSPSM